MLDEVVCGTGRANPNGVLNCWEIFLDGEDSPDIQTVSKTLDFGYVIIAGILISQKILKGFISGSGLVLDADTYHTHALNCSVALQIQEKVKSLGLTKSMFEKETRLGSKSREELADESIIADVRGLEGVWTIEFVKDKKTKTNFSSDLKIANRVSKTALKIRFKHHDFNFV